MSWQSKDQSLEASDILPATVYTCSLVTLVHVALVSCFVAISRVLGFR